MTWGVVDLEADPCVLSPYAVHKGGYVYVTREGKQWLSCRASDFGDETMTPPRIYKAHLFKSVDHPSLWACVSRHISTKPGRAIEPVPYAPVSYGSTPHLAFKRWLSRRS